MDRRSMLRRHLSRDHGYTDDEVEQVFGGADARAGAPRRARHG